MSTFTQKQHNTVATLMVDYLERRGIDYVFGLCGHTNIAFLSALEQSAIEFITVRHEQIAAHAADGYARVTKKASVLLCHLTPGLSNAATGVLNAALDCIPMVVIAGDVPTHYYGKHPHQEVNLHADSSQHEIYRPFVKRVWRVDNANLLPEILDKAFIVAQSGQPGPVLINVPMDIFSQKIDPALFARLSNKINLSQPTISDESAKQIVRTLAEANNPVIYAGGGVLLADASESLAEFVDYMQIPVAYSLMGKGCISDKHPLNLGMTGFWGTELVNQNCLQADYIFGIATRFKEADCSSWEKGYTFNIPDSTKLIHLDIDPIEIGRNYPVEIGVIADAKQALQRLTQVAKKMYPQGFPPSPLVAKIAEFKTNFRQRNAGMATSDAFPMMPERILADARDVLPDNAILTTDVGWNKNGVGQQFDITVPGSILTPGGAATMGFGPPAAIGAKLAARERIVVSMVGDGGFGQNPALLSTAVEMNLHIIWIVMNNNAFGTIAGLQKAHYGVTYGTVFKSQMEQQDVNYANIAIAYGAVGVRIESADAFKPALIDALANKRPTVIDVPMKNNPTPTTGHWNILDIYSPDSDISHVATD